MKRFVLNMKKFVLIAVFLVGILVIGTTISFIVVDYQNDNEQKYINEHASTTAIVTDKYIQSAPRGGYNFHVVAEHSSVTSNGKETTFIIDYYLPEENLIDYYHIEVGDNIIAKYTHYVRSGSWEYVSFEKTK